MKRSAYVSRRLVAAVACVAVATTVAACGSSDDGGGSGGGGETSEAAAAPGKNEIVFGAMLPVTGDYAPFTKPAIFANNIAIEEINADGGVLGKKVKLVIADTKSTAEAAVPAFDRLTEVSKSTVLGVGDSDAAIAVLDAIAEKQLPTMCPYCGADALTPGGGEWVYRLSPADGQLGIAAAQFARDNGYAKAAVLGQKTDASVSAVEAFEKPYTDSGGDLCEEVMFDPGKSSYQAEVQKAFSCDPEVVYATTGTEAGIPIMREWARRGYGGKWLLSQDMLTPDIAKSTPELEGNAFGPTGSMDTSTPAFESFAEKYKEKSGGKAPSDGLWEAASFDQWIMAALAMEKAKSTDGAKIATAVPEIANAPGTKCYRYKECLDLIKKGEDIDYYGASGANDLNADGDLASPRFTTTELKGGEFVSGEAFNLDPELTK